MDSAAFVDFLEKLPYEVDRKIFLVAGGFRTHTSKATRKYVESVGQIAAENVKHDNAERFAARTSDEFRQGIQQALDRLRAAPEVIRGFFENRDFGCIYI